MIESLAPSSKAPRVALKSLPGKEKLFSRQITKKQQSFWSKVKNWLKERANTAPRELPNPSLRSGGGAANKEMLEQATRMYTRRFSKTPELQRLWKQASQGQASTPKGFAKSRERFWKMVNNPTSPDAEYVAHKLEIAGLKLAEGTSKAPLLKVIPGTKVSYKIYRSSFQRLHLCKLAKSINFMLI